MKTAIVSIVLASVTAHAVPAKTVNSAWAEFQKSPQTFMNKQPKKYDADGRSVREPIFDRRSIKRRSFVDTKTELRRERFGSGAPLAFFAGNSTRKKTMDFFDVGEFRRRGLEPILRLETLEAKKLTAKNVTTQPWSGSYWPLYQGGIASRFASAKFDRASTGWRSSYDYVLGNSLSDVIKRNDPQELDELSPAEKYDLVIADPLEDPSRPMGFLTPRIWEATARYANSEGEVERWMGLCHGWSSAALLVPRPTTTVRVPGATESRAIKFYPDEMKALATQLWADADYPTNFIGGRCDKKNPKVDPQTGRILDPECFDVNPAVWHLIIANQVGQLERGFVMDVTYDYEVWNQPVSSYKYEYFNPQTGEKSSTLAGATVAMADFKKDKFTKFRDPKSVSAVGVEMTVEYTVETSATQKEVDSSEDDSIRRVTYVYDIELSATGEPIGGEWYSNSHPDFLWVAKNGAKATTSGDSTLPAGAAYDPTQPIPRFWRGIAARTADVEGQPLAIVVEGLMGAASRP